MSNPFGTETAASQHQCLVVAQVTDLLSQFPSFGTFRKNGCNLEVRFQQAHELGQATLAWAYELCEQNMRSMYEEVWGWKPAEKQKELKHSDARYLVVYGADGSAVAYVHFRYACLLLLSFEAMRELSLVLLPSLSQKPPLAIIMKHVLATRSLLLAISNSSYISATFGHMLKQPFDISSILCSSSWCITNYSMIFLHQS